MAASEFPLFNGQPVSWAELRMTLEHDGGTFTAGDFQSIDWAHGLDPGEPVYGTGPAPIAHTQGKYSVKTSKLGMLKASARRLRLALAGRDKRYGLVSFSLHASWDQGDGVIHTLEWRGARIKDEAGQTAAGSTEALKEDIDCAVLRIFEDGVCPVGDQ